MQFDYQTHFTAKAAGMSLPWLSRAYHQNTIVSEETMTRAETNKIASSTCYRDHSYTTTLQWYTQVHIRAHFFFFKNCQGEDWFGSKTGNNYNFYIQKTPPPGAPPGNQLEIQKTGGANFLDFVSTSILCFKLVKIQNCWKRDLQDSEFLSRDVLFKVRWKKSCSSRTAIVTCDDRYAVNMEHH